MTRRRDRLRADDTLPILHAATEAAALEHARLVAIAETAARLLKTRGETEYARVLVDEAELDDLEAVVLEVAPHV